MTTIVFSSMFVLWFMVKLKKFVEPYLASLLTVSLSNILFNVRTICFSSRRASFYSLRVTFSTVLRGRKVIYGNNFMTRLWKFFEYCEVSVQFFFKVMHILKKPVYCQNWGNVKFKECRWVACSEISLSSRSSAVVTETRIFALAVSNETYGSY